MICQHATLVNCFGLHARAAAELVTLASGFACRIEVRYQQRTADAKSIMSLLMLAAPHGSSVDIICDGTDENTAMTKILALIDDCFGEEK